MSWLDPDLPCSVVLYIYADVIGVRFIEEAAPSLPESIAVSLCSVEPFAAGEEPTHG